MKKRFDIYKRDKVGIICEVIVPFLLVFFGCCLSFINRNPPVDPVKISPLAYPDPQYMLMNNATIVEKYYETDDIA